MIYSDSEIARLRKVIVHRPDDGIGRVSPKRAEELLFDDIVYLPQMQAEHDIFRKILEYCIGADNVLETEQLLEESLYDLSSRNNLINNVLEFEELPQNYSNYFSGLSPKELANVLITGYLKEEAHVFFDPIPNFIFTRDIAVTIKDHVIITKAAKDARQRENLLTRFIFVNHPLFEGMLAEGKIIDLNNLEAFPPSKNGEKVSIEGGDIMMIANDYIFIGCSERTTDHAIQSLSKVLFEKGLVKHIAQINIPADRTMMHIDTIFTRISEDDIVCYKPTVFDGNSSNVIVHHADSSKSSIYASVKDFVHAEINPEMNFIFAGKGKSPYQEREQWTDGCNLVALKPGVGITYDRNHVTADAFRDAGYTILPAEDLIKQAKLRNFDFDKLENTIISIPSGELSRARGGSHCMTCPILRERL